MKESHLKRRDFVKLITAGTAGLFLWGSGCAPGLIGLNRRKARPNVLFIAVDDLNDWVGCLGGHSDVKTPNIDRLAGRGVLFERGYCPAPLCNPSRASLLSGVRPSTSGVYGNKNPLRAALPDAVTLPQHFMAHGYRVIGGGKIFHGRFPDPESWHEYFPSKTRARPDDPKVDGRPLNGIKNAGGFDWGPVDVLDEEMSDTKVAQWAAEELAWEHDRPFFLAAGIFRPHLPWYVPRKYFEMYPVDRIALPVVKDDDLDDVPPIGKRFAIDGVGFSAAEGGDHAQVIERGLWREAVQGYLASVTFADAQVGKLLDALDNSPCRENTIVVLFGDHGWHLGEKLHWRKHALWEEATRNTFIISTPDAAGTGRRCPRTVSLIDIYPTLIDLCGLTPKDKLEGHSLLPLLKNPLASWKWPAISTYCRNNHSIRTERWRYTRYCDGKEELYDHEHDEMEWRNLADDPAYAGTRNDLTQWLPAVNAPMSGHIQRDDVQDLGDEELLDYM